MAFVIDGKWLTLNAFENILSTKEEVLLGDNARKKITDCRNYLDSKLSGSGELIYGINTGFGSLCNTAIEAGDLEQLQRNLVLSHACGVGETVSEEIIRRMLLLKAIGLSQGNSGAQVETVERLLFFYNQNIFPVVYKLGSLGASGDLAPLAHLSLPLIGEGEVTYKGQQFPSHEVLKKFGLQAITLKSKEGLALLNGTQFMSAFASYAVANGRALLDGFNLVGVLSLEAYDGRINPFQENVNAIRNQIGQISVAKYYRECLSDSSIIKRPKVHVQDPYSFRCIPQVHGATMDAIEYVSGIVEREINAVTDNPTIFPEEDDVVSAGNFHGQPLAITMDFLAIALAELGSISERRVYKLISGTRDLPAFLVAKPGLNSGFMIPQYAAASIVSQNKQLCAPCSIDSIDSSNGQEDHVSMGANAGTKLYQLIQNCWSLLGIELLNAAQAMDFRKEEGSSVTAKLRADLRNHVPFVEVDVFMQPLIKQSEVFVRQKFNLA